jgi:hypothetical protein
MAALPILATKALLMAFFSYTDYSSRYWCDERIHCVSVIIIKTTLLVSAYYLFSGTGFQKSTLVPSSPCTVSSAQILCRV